MSERKYLRCRCGQAFDISDCQVGQRFSCSKCNSDLVVQQSDLVEVVDRWDDERQVLFCGGCQMPISLAKATPGKKMGCPSCARIFTVPAGAGPRPDPVPAVVEDPDSADVIPAWTIEAEQEPAKQWPADESGVGPAPAWALEGGQAEPVDEPEPQPEPDSGEVAAAFAEEAKLAEPTRRRRGATTAKFALSAVVAALTDGDEEAKREASSSGFEWLTAVRKKKDVLDATSISAAPAPAPPMPKPAPKPEVKSEQAEPKPGKTPGTILCTNCSAEVDVREMGAGRHVMCPECEHGLVVPGKPASSRRRKAKQRGKRAESGGKGRVMVLCKGCMAKVDVTELDPGTTVLCPECEGDIVAPEPAGSGAHAPVKKRHEISDSRKVFSQFYDSFEQGEGEEAVDAGPSTRPTLRASAEVLRGESARRSLVDALERSKAVKAKEVVHEEPPRVFLGVFLAAVGLVAALFVGIYIKSVYWDMPAMRANREAGSGSAQPPPVQKADALRPGAQVEILGVVLGGEGAVLAGGNTRRVGCVLIVRGVGELWCEDATGTAQPLFAQLAERHKSGMRTALKIVGTVAAIGKLSDLAALHPSVKGHKVWIEIDKAEFLRWSVYQTGGNSVTVVSGGDGDGSSGG